MYIYVCIHAGVYDGVYIGFIRLKAYIGFVGYDAALAPLIYRIRGCSCFGLS